MERISYVFISGILLITLGLLDICGWPFYPLISEKASEFIDDHQDKHYTSNSKAVQKGALSL
ncbi:hypothetical protein [Legionella waltersii]|uniref:Uncharacterized protein n=1 Tax=Legionella waltersii TaxID=66969 RepID=A0A0W1AB07_9GAMM|nr:hypothetical protein [Legionella waltersii]KTD78471.1 hypothetical protein Lwal_1906 [Legionella waltersii]SNV05880.1 Uncharacterised protein [Legionella waltersii]